jgi:hypothetical protein
MLPALVGVMRKLTTLKKISNGMPLTELSALELAIVGQLVAVGLAEIQKATAFPTTSGFSALKRYQVVNLDRAGCIAHIPESVKFDHGAVMDNESWISNPLTGAQQRAVVFSGLIPACLAWVDSQVMGR